MEVETINLLPTRTKINWQYWRMIRRWQRDLKWLAIFLIVNGLLILLARWQLQRRVKLLAAERTTIKEDLRAFLPYLRAQLRARGKIKLAASVLRKRQIISRRLQQVKEFLGPGAVLDEVIYRGGKLAIQGHWRSLSAWADFDRRTRHYRRWLPNDQFSVVTVQAIQMAPGNMRFSLLIHL